MEQATAAKTRAELGRLVVDLPAEPAVAGAVAAPASAPASWHVSPVGGLRVSGPWRMARHVIVASIVGGYPAGPERGAAGRPRGHADHRVAGGRDPDHGPAGDPDRGVGLQPGRRNQGRGRPGTVRPVRRPSTSARSRWSAGSGSSAAGHVETGDRGGTGAPSRRTGAPGAATGGPSVAPSGDRGGAGPDTLLARPRRWLRLIERSSAAAHAGADQDSRAVPARGQGTQEHATASLEWLAAQRRR